MSSCPSGDGVVVHEDEEEKLRGESGGESSSESDERSTTTVSTIVLGTVASTGTLASAAIVPTGEGVDMHFDVLFALTCLESEAR